MRMTAFIILEFLVCCASLSAQQETMDGSGRVIEASLPASNFNRVDMAAVGDVHIKRDNREELRIKVDDNLLPYFKTKVVDGVLVIYLNPPVSLQPTQPIELDLSVKDLQEIRLSGAAKINAPHLEAEQFSVALTGAGNVAMADFYAKKLTVWMPGAGNVMISGRVDEQDITLPGSGRYQAGNLTSTNAAIRIDGAGNADLQMRDVLHAEIHGAGTIRYGGHPRTVGKSVTGAGTIIAVE
jgi:predicted small secreted protein